MNRGPLREGGDIEDEALDLLVGTIRDLAKRGYRMGWRDARIGYRLCEGHEDLECGELIDAPEWNKKLKCLACIVGDLSHLAWDACYELRNGNIALAMAMLSSMSRVTKDDFNPPHFRFREDIENELDGCDPFHRDMTMALCETAARVIREHPEAKDYMRAKR